MGRAGKVVRRRQADFRLSPLSRLGSVAPAEDRHVRCSHRGLAGDLLCRDGDECVGAVCVAMERGLPDARPAEPTASTPTWRPVTDDEPADGVCVIATDGDWVGALVRDSESEGDYGWGEPLFGQTADLVPTYWMPLPPAPEDEE